MRLSICALRRTVLAAAAAGILAPAAGHAQQANPSPAATGMGGNYTALAKGYSAVAWNPAMLGMPGNPRFSITALALGGSAGLRPIDLADLKTYSGQFVPVAVREEWLTQIADAGSQSGGGDVGATWLAMNIGPVALQASTSTYASMGLGPDAMEIILFGNAGRTPGTVKALSMEGSSLRTGAFSTIAASIGLPLPGAASLTAAEMSAGLTLKQVFGHLALLGLGMDAGGSVDDVRLRFPMVNSDLLSDNGDGGVTAGSGFGADIGFAWRASRLTVGATVQNVFNSFAWDESKFVYRPGNASFDGEEENETDFDEQPFAGAPAVLKDMLANNRFRPTLAAGVAFRALDNLTVTSDLRQQMGDDDAIVFGPKTQLGVGAEYRVVPFLPLRAGVTAMSGGVGVSGGFGLQVLGFQLGVGANLRNRDNGQESGFTVSMLSLF